MKHQQVVVDYWSMVKTSCTCLLLSVSGYVLMKMIQTIFWLPAYLQNNQKRLEELAEKYSLELEKAETEEKNTKVTDEKEDNNSEEIEPSPSKETIREDADEKKKEK